MGQRHLGAYNISGSNFGSSTRPDFRPDVSWTRVPSKRSFWYFLARRARRQFWNIEGPGPRCAKEIQMEPTWRSRHSGAHSFERQSPPPGGGRSEERRVG